MTLLGPGARSVVFAQGAPPVSLEQTFNAQYAFGGLVTVRTGGISGVNSDCSQPNTFTFKDGQLHPPGRLQKALSLGATAGRCASRSFVEGSKAMIALAGVVIRNNEIVIGVFQCDGCDNQDKDQRVTAAANGAVFRANVVFQFPKGFLVTAGMAPVQDAITRVFTVDPGGNGKDEGTGGQLQTQTGVGAPPTLGTAYVSSNNKEDTLTLTADGSFRLHEGGQMYTGAYSVTGTILKLHIVQLQKEVEITIRGDQLVVNGDEIWGQPRR
jgi:hypothetical protein